MPLDLSEIANDPDLGEPQITIIRTLITFVPGGTAKSTTKIDTCGIITVADSTALQQIPEGDRVTGSLQVITPIRLVQTNEREQTLADKIVWRGNTYQVQAVDPWGDDGFWSAIFVRLTGS